jgi:hypothetical protein
MSVRPSHEDVEAEFVSLLASADMPAPDEVGYEPDGVVFRWYEQKLVVFVDFDSDQEQLDGADARGRPP